MLPTVSAPRVMIPLALVVLQMAVAQTTMIVEELKILGRFLRLVTPTFVEAPGDDALEFVTTYEESHHNLGLVEARGVDYITCQLDIGREFVLILCLMDLPLS